MDKWLDRHIKRRKKETAEKAEEKPAAGFISWKRIRRGAPPWRAGQQNAGERHKKGPGEARLWPCSRALQTLTLPLGALAVAGGGTVSVAETRGRGSAQMDHGIMLRFTVVPVAPEEDNNKGRRTKCLFTLHPDRIPTGNTIGMFSPFPYSPYSIRASFSSCSRRGLWASPQLHLWSLSS